VDKASFNKRLMVIMIAPRAGNDQDPTEFGGRGRPIVYESGPNFWGRGHEGSRKNVDGYGHAGPKSALVLLVNVQLVVVTLTLLQATYRPKTALSLIKQLVRLTTAWAELAATFPGALAYPPAYSTSVKVRVA